MIYLACIFYACMDFVLFPYLGVVGVPLAMMLGVATIWLIGSRLPGGAKIALISLCLVVFCVYPALILSWGVGPMALHVVEHAGYYLFFLFRAAIFLLPTIVLFRLLRGRPADQ